MSFTPEHITIEHISAAVQRIKKENISLRSSTGYDVIIDKEAYPPKEIMRYAHEEMNGERIWELSGGAPTNTYLEQLGYTIMEKEKNKELHQLKQDFLDAWPLERVKEMGLEEYTDLKRDDSFCYWVESKTRPLGSIQGGTSYKFGIYKRENTDSEDSRDAYLTDGDYAWLKKYGETKEEAFKNVKQIVVDVVEASSKEDLAIIDSIDLGDAYKWKIAFLYSDHKVINILSTPNIRWVGEYKGFEAANTAPISEIHNYVLSEKPSDVDFYDYSKELWSAFNKMEAQEIETVTEDKELSSMSLNQILYGPPGTGKTYHTVNKALQIVDPEFYEANKVDRKALTKRFRELLITDWENHKSGQIASTTFHQSFSYEDFIEGIKPILLDRNSDNEEIDTETDSSIGYEIQNGIFKNISELARQQSGGKVGLAKGLLKWDREQFNKAEFYKLSLGNVNIIEDDEIYKYCIENNRIGIGFLWDEDLTNVEEAKINQIHIDNSDYDKHDCTSMAIFRHHLKGGYYVVIASGNHKFRAIGKVVGDYFYDKDSPIRYPHFRKVEWIAKDLDLSVDLVYNKKFSQKTIYHLRKKDIKPEFFIRSKATPIQTSEKKPYVLIVDEINRGNIAQIFGELITLIEEDKREGMDEETSVSLPYSKQPFSVPSNLHIIGTMNTADRSIEALDTALRRRFTFEEMPPKPKAIEDEGALKGDKSEIQVGESYFLLSKILETINKRIEKLLDKDHLIGHSYFMDVSEVSDLKRVFYRNIIPLLEEYFYGDKGKIQLVLGRGFIKQTEYSVETELFAKSDYDDSVFEDREVWELTTGWRYNDKAFEEALNILFNKET
jgi:5-methylcytosine-specific restriction protein B